MKKIILIFMLAVTAFAQMNYTPKNEEFKFTKVSCWNYGDEIICEGGELNIFQAQERVIADTIPITDCISLDSLRRHEAKIEQSDSLKFYWNPRLSGLLNVGTHLDLSCTDPFVRNLNSDKNRDLVYVRLYRVIFKSFNCPKNPTKIFYDNEWTAKRVIYECVENPEDYEIHDLEYGEWHRKNGITYPGAIVRRK